MLSRIALTAFAVISISNCCLGDLIIDITDAGSGQTRFALSGSNVASSNGGFNNESLVFPNLFSVAPTLNITDSSLESNTAVFSNTTRGLTEAFSSAQIRNNPTHQIILDLAATLNVKSGENLSASGSFVADFDFANFNPGSYSFTDSRTGQWRVNVSAVPEPSSLAFCSLAIAGLLTRRRN